MVIFLWLQSRLLAPSRAINLNFWRSMHTLLKRTFWKRWRTRNTKLPETYGQFIDGNTAPLGKFNLVWNSVLRKVLHAYKPGWRLFFACNNYIPLIYDYLWNMFLLIGSQQVYQIFLRFRGRSRQGFPLFKWASNCFPSQPHLSWHIAHP